MSPIDLHRSVRHLALAVIIASTCALAPIHAAIAAEPGPGSAAAWPSRPIRLIASVGAGSSLDALARMIATRLAMNLGQGVVVENRAGAAGNIATDAVARSTPDGYTLLFTSNSIATLPALMGPRATDPVTALAPVSMVASQPIVIVAHPSFAGTTFGDMVGAARKAPGDVPYATSGVGSFAHLTALWVQSRAGIAMLHIPYAGSQSFKDVLSGEVPFAFAFPGSAVPLIRSGQLKAIAVTSVRRFDVVRDVPSLHESGLPGFDVMNWQGLLAPAGTPAGVVERLHAALARIGADAEFDARLRSMGFTPVFSSPSQFAADIRQETERWAAIVKSAGLKLD